MICAKCGTKNKEGSKFCKNCGKLIEATEVNSINTNEISSTVESESSRQENVESMKEQAIKPNIAAGSLLNNGEYKKNNNINAENTVQTEKAESKKKSKRWLIGLGVGVVAVIIIAVLIAVNWEGKVDYIATVGDHQPFKSQGYSYTYSTVLNKYIDDVKWETRKSGDTAYVDISGRLAGSGEDVKIIIKVSPNESDPDMVVISPQSVTIGEEQSTTTDDAVRFILLMFDAYENGYKSFFDYIADEPTEITETEKTIDTGSFEEKPTETEIIETTNNALNWLDVEEETKDYLSLYFTIFKNASMNTAINDYSLANARNVFKTGSEQTSSYYCLFIEFAKRYYSRFSSASLKTFDIGGFSYVGLKADEINDFVSKCFGIDFLTGQDFISFAKSLPEEYSVFDDYVMWYSFWEGEMEFYFYSNVAGIKELTAGVYIVDGERGFTDRYMSAFDVPESERVYATFTATVAVNPDDTVRIIEYKEQFIEHPDADGTDNSGDSPEWKTSLKNFLMGFPSLFDDSWLDEYYRNRTAPSDAIIFEDWGFAAPFEYKFYDLDSDGIPEVSIYFAIPESDNSWNEIYRLYGDKYENIGTSSRGEIFYTNAQNQLVVVEEYFDIYSINFAAIINGEIIRTNYTDSNGNIGYNGKKYGEFYVESDTDFEYMENLINNVEKLKAIPEFDCSDVVAEVKDIIKINLIDNAGLLTYEQGNSILSNLDRLSEKYECEVVIVTENAEISDIQGRADLLIESYGENGIILYINMYESGWAVSIYGKCVEIFNDSKLDKLTAEILPRLNSGDFNGAFSSFIESCETYLGF